MDRISRLPDEILQHILSFLPTKYAVATSILSSRWTDLWLFLPVLDFDDSLYLHPQKNRYKSTNARRKDLFMEFVDVVLSLNHSPNLSRFRLCIDVEDQADLSDTNEWIQSILQRNVVELDLSITQKTTKCQYNLQIPPSQSLQVLRICSYCGLNMPISGEFFPNLKTFELEAPFEDIEDKLTINLFTSLPRLEKLSISGQITPKTGSLQLDIVGAALKSLVVYIREKRKFCYHDASDAFYRHQCDAMVQIDAPHLEYLHLKDDFLVSYSIKNIATNCKVNLDVNLVDVGELIGYEVEDCYSVIRPKNPHYPNESSILLMQEICNAEGLLISASTTRALMNAIDKNLPTFHLLTKLELTLHPCGWNLFLHWLHNSPNLQFLVLKKQEYYEEISTEDEWSFLDCVPTCLLLHLKEVEIKGLRKQEEDKVLTYLRTNARVLQKITLNSHILPPSHKKCSNSCGHKI